MINPFVLKKFAVILLGPMVSAIALSVGTLFYNFWIGLVLFFCALLPIIVISIILLKNPFTDMLEGKGILAFDIASPGIISPFVVQVGEDYVQGKLRGNLIKDIFDRKAVFNMKPPIKEGKANIDSKSADKNITIELSKNAFNDVRFGLFQYPTLIYNSQVKSFVTREAFLSKEGLGKMEKDMLVEHNILYLQRTVNDLSSHILHFARATVELATKPKFNLMQSWVFWIVLGVFIFILLALFGPALLDSIMGFIDPATSAVATATGSASAVNLQ